MNRMMIKVGADFPSDHTDPGEDEAWIAERKRRHELMVSEHFNDIPYEDIRATLIEKYPEYFV